MVPCALVCLTMLSYVSVWYHLPFLFHIISLLLFYLFPKLPLVLTHHIALDTEFTETTADSWTDNQYTFEKLPYGKFLLNLPPSVDPDTKLPCPLIPHNSVIKVFLISSFTIPHHPSITSFFPSSHLRFFLLPSFRQLRICTSDGRHEDRISPWASYVTRDATAPLYHQRLWNPPQVLLCFSTPTTTPTTTTTLTPTTPLQ